MIRTCPLLAAVALATTAASAQASDAIQVQLDRVDTLSAFNQAAWWSPIAHDPVDGAVSLTYLRPRPGSTTYDDVWIARKSADGHWTTANTGGGSYHDAGHTQASLAIDGNGYAHLFYGMHGGAIKYRRSDVPRSVTQGFTAAQPVAFAGGDFTYPNLTTDPSGDAWLIIRNYPGGDLYRFDIGRNEWSRAQTFARHAGTTVYPDEVFAGPDGQLHLIWEWAAGTPQASRHLGSYARYDPSSGTFFRADGSAYGTGPITPATADLFQPLEGQETFTAGVHGVQSAKMALDDAGHPLIVYAYSADGTASGYAHRLAHWNGVAWERRIIEPGPFDLDKAWITWSDGLLRVYGTLSPDAPLATGTDDIFLRTSSDFGATWSTPIAITDGLNIQRPMGVSADGVDYLYLPDAQGGALYLATVVVPEPATAPLMTAGAGLLLRRRRLISPSRPAAPAVCGACGG